MPTVSQAVQILEQLTDVPSATIRGVARKLIDDGILPKSVGRRIETISPDQFIKLLLATYCSTTIADASRSAQRYFDIPPINYEHDIVPSAESTPSYFSECHSSGSAMTTALNYYLSSGRLPDDFTGNLHIKIYMPYPAVRIVRHNYRDTAQDWAVYFDAGRPAFTERGTPAGRVPSRSVEIPLAFFSDVAKAWHEANGTSPRLQLPVT